MRRLPYAEADRAAMRVIVAEAVVGVKRPRGDSLCRNCIRWKSEHVGIFLACPDRGAPEPGEQMYLDDTMSGATP
jgi:hypothetical protein